MIRAELRIRLPAELWINELSEAYPDAIFTLLSGYPVDGRAVELGEITADDPNAVVETLDAHPAITDLEVLKSTGSRSLGKYETTDTALYEFVEASKLPIEFPVVVRNGWFEFDLTGTREELERLRTTIEAAGGAYELQSIVSTTDDDALVTDRQREVLEAAIRAGYYEVPRECTLADLAATLDVDKSTASTVLRRGEATVLKWFLGGPNASGGRGR
ncbi:helix-turn-helix domain-containing protein [Natrarchaeobius oligotrophus]|uniref:Bacterio-opsin activator n=1 Tax=Natrarchaeobius chitinivorans TaxID=1679083 RepID=A0A3N6M6N8_NATCH|nr:helix-turn-helix domain-containing protein [Natrarchaeobius chitinivorans]RQG96264.1 bacterio-opsin activator [Natrarchaeobius chitinivorans]